MVDLIKLTNWPTGIGPVVNSLSPLTNLLISHRFLNMSNNLLIWGLVIFLFHQFSPFACLETLSHFDLIEFSSDFISKKSHNNNYRNDVNNKNKPFSRTPIFKHINHHNGGRISISQSVVGQPIQPRRAPCSTR